MGNRERKIIMISRENIDALLVEIDNKLNTLESVKDEINVGAVNLISRSGDLDFNALELLTNLETLENNQRLLKTELTYAISELNQTLYAYKNSNKPSTRIDEMEFKCNVMSKVDNVIMRAMLLNIPV